MPVEVVVSQFEDVFGALRSLYDLPVPLCTVRTLAELRAAVASAPFAV